MQVRRVISPKFTKNTTAGNTSQIAQTIAGIAAERSAKTKTASGARRGATLYTRLADRQEAIFDAMLAEMDSRIEDIRRRTDRLIAKVFWPSCLCRPPRRSWPRRRLEPKDVHEN